MNNTKKLVSSQFADNIAELNASLEADLIEQSFMVLDELD